MKKHFAIRTLNRIKEMQEIKIKLKDLGIDLINYEDGVNLLEESVALLFTHDELQFERALTDVQWWLYERAEKILHHSDGKKQDLTDVEDFVNWLEDWYKQ